MADTAAVGRQEVPLSDSKVEEILDMVRQLEWRGGPDGPRAYGLAVGVAPESSAVGRDFEPIRVRRNWPPQNPPKNLQGYYVGLSRQVCYPRAVSVAPSGGLAAWVGVVTSRVFEVLHEIDGETRGQLLERQATLEAAYHESWLGESIALVVAWKVGIISKEEARERAGQHGLHILVALMNELPR